MYTAHSVLHRGQILSPWLGDKVDSGKGFRSTLEFGCPNAHGTVLVLEFEVIVNSGIEDPIHHVFLWIRPQCSSPTYTAQVDIHILHLLHL
jgi:hypothetical protein